MKKHYFIFLSLSLFVFECSTGPDYDQEPDHSNLRIVLSDSLEVLEVGGNFRLPKIITELNDVLVSESKNCNKVFVLDPSLVRLDQDKDYKDFSLKTIIEKGGAKKTTHPKVISKLINKYFDEVDVPEAFVKASKPDFRTATQVQNWLTTKAVRDSTIVLITSDVTTRYVLGGKTYPTFTDVITLREHIQKVLCQNDKANFVVLYNPPNADSTDDIIIGGNNTITTGPSTVTSQTTITQIGVIRGETRTRRTTRVQTKKPPRNGICDYDTHTLYERVVNANGRPQRGDKVLVMNCKDCGY